MLITRSTLVHIFINVESHDGSSNVYRYLDLAVILVAGIDGMCWRLLLHSQ
jgi:hypothetical protein